MTIKPLMIIVVETDVPTISKKRHVNN